MNKFLLVLFSILFYQTLHLNAQTGIGTTSPDPSAKLDVTSTNKGFLPPRVTLTGYMDNTTIPTPATGLLVYNTGTNVNLAAGYYYWNGNAWATIATAGGSGSFASSYMRGSRTAAQSGLTQNSVVQFSQIENNSGSDISLNTTTGQITLLPNRTYRLIGGVPNFYGGRPAFMWYNETTSAYIGNATNTYSPSDAAANGAFGGNAQVIITPNVTTVLTFRLLSNTTTSASGNGDFPSSGSFPWFEAQVISGNANVTGQSVDYGIAAQSSSQTISSVGNITFNSIIGAGITLNNGGFNLIANKTYKLEGSVGGSATSGGYIYYAWVDASNNIIGGGSMGASMRAGDVHNDAFQEKATAFYTPTSNTTVYLRALTVVGTYNTQITSSTPNWSSTWATIQQIGSSAIVNPWTLSGTNTYNTTGNVGIGNNAPASKLDVTGDVNVTGKINVSDPTGNLVSKATGFVARGADVTLGNLKVRFAASGNMSMQVSSTGVENYSVYGSGVYVSGGVGYSNIDGSAPLSITTTPTYLKSSISYGGAGNTDTWIIMDTSKGMTWRIIGIVGSGYTTNYISIERLN